MSIVGCTDVLAVRIRLGGCMSLLAASQFLDGLQRVCGFCAQFFWVAIEFGLPVRTFSVGCRGFMALRKAYMGYRLILAAGACLLWVANDRMANRTLLLGYSCYVASAHNFFGLHMFIGCWRITLMGCSHYMARSHPVLGLKSYFG